MIDLELNKAIAEALGWELKPAFFPLVKENKTDKVFLCIKEDGSVPFAFDFNNWHQLMPLVVEHDLCFINRREDGYHGMGRYMVQHITVLEDDNHLYTETFNDNPQRALAECLLKVLQNR